MKKFTVKAVASAVGVVCAAVAHAGSISTPATDAAATVYAVEAMTNGTALTLPTIRYTMGVSRTVAQDFTVILTPSAGTSFTVASCTTAIPTLFAGTGTIVASLKRASTTECAYEVDVTTATDTTSILQFAGLGVSTHTLGAAGSNISVTLALKDLGETAFIDNSGTLTRQVARSVQSVNIYAAASDTATVADVNATTGPLTGFVAGGAAPADTATIAKANLTFDNNFVNAKLPDGTTNFDFVATTGTATVVLSGINTGAAANGFCLDTDNDATLCEVGERFTMGTNVSTLAGITSAMFPAQGTMATRMASFQADGSTQLGTSRTFALTGTIMPQVGGANALANTASVNATAWVWGANASQLMTPYITTDNSFLTRYFLLNTGTLPVGYNATCYAEAGNTITYGAGRNGTLTASGLTAVNARDVCTFSGNTRGSVIFTINAPINTVKGSYQYISPTTLNGANTPMVRPYNQANTTE